VYGSCTIPVSDPLHVPLLHPLNDSGALQITPRPLHVRDCLTLCTAMGVILFSIHCLSSVEPLHIRVTSMEVKEHQGNQNLV
jgi:hypothetical protein